MAPMRSNSLAKPKLKVQIPVDDETDEKATADPSDNPRPLTTTNKNPNHVLTPIREPGLTPGPVLPPPSPSASALLSAGASGPPNPFARPLPPQPNGNNPPAGRDLDTPISALPSRFMENGLLPSPSSFYPEWSFGGRDGGSSAGGTGGNMLPSPLTFQTPVNVNGPSFLRDGEGLGGEKRKLEPPGQQQGEIKRVKT